METTASCINMSLLAPPPAFSFFSCSWSSVLRLVHALRWVGVRAQAALAVAMVCFGLDFASIFFGLSIFMMKVSIRWYYWRHGL